MNKPQLIKEINILISKAEKSECFDVKKAAGILLALNNSMLIGDVHTFHGCVSIYCKRMFGIYKLIMPS